MRRQRYGIGQVSQPMPTCQAQGASSGDENTDLARKEIDMNYYKQGNAAKADQINAAFKKLGIDVLDFGFADKTVVYCCIKINE